MEEYEEWFSAISGYPLCCVRAFSDGWWAHCLQPETKKRLAGKGYVPCPECERRVLSGETFTDIIGRRSWPDKKVMTALKLAWYLGLPPEAKVLDRWAE